LKIWDEIEKEDHGINVEIIKSTPEELNKEKWMKFLMDKHEAGTYYPESYLKQIRKIMNSKSGKLGGV
jgi:hypothetical protein